MTLNTYETSAIVEDQGQLRLAGLPFAPGTEVQITISSKGRSESEMTPPDDEVLEAARDRMGDLFRTIKGFRNSPRIAREELYERGSLR